MVAIIKALDAATQRHVDETAHGLMRTFDITKATVRFSVMQFTALTVLARCIYAYRSPMHASQVPIIAILGVCLVMVSGRLYRIDRATETSRNAMSYIDAFLMRHGAFLKTIMLLMLVNQIASLLAPEFFKQERLMTLLSLISWIPEMAFIYLGATSPTPPPQQQRMEFRERELVPIPIRVRR